jgi:5-methylcytosine-specific restriction endonuclease McrA
MEIDAALCELGSAFVDSVGLRRMRDPQVLMREASAERLLHRRSVPLDMREKIFERDGHKCKTCGSENDLQADHVVPFSKGGLTHPDNLQTLCQPCNGRKGARL